MCFYAYQNILMAKHADVKKLHREDPIEQYGLNDGPRR